MGKSCAVWGCSPPQTKGFGVYGFPKDKHRRRLWTKFVQISRQKFDKAHDRPSAYDSICEKHFAPDDFEGLMMVEMGKRRFKTLSKCAVPTLCARMQDKLNTSSDSGPKRSRKADQDGDVHATRQKRRSLAVVKLSNARLLNEYSKANDASPALHMLQDKDATMMRHGTVTQGYSGSMTQGHSVSTRLKQINHNNFWSPARMDTSHTATTSTCSNRDNMSTSDIKREVLESDNTTNVCNMGSTTSEADNKDTHSHTFHSEYIASDKIKTETFSGSAEGSYFDTDVMTPYYNAENIENCKPEDVGLLAVKQEDNTQHTEYSYCNNPIGTLFPLDHNYFNWQQLSESSPSLSEGHIDSAPECDHGDMMVGVDQLKTEDGYDNMYPLI